MSKWGKRKKREPQQYVSKGIKPNPFMELYESEIWQKPYDFPVPEYPLLVDIEPTNHCNFNCKFCSRNVMKRRKGFMDLALFKRITDELRGKVKYLKFSRWGEPFMHPDIYTMFAIAKRKGFFVHVTTNGSLVNIRRLKHVDTIYFSMQGLNADEYHLMRNYSYKMLTKKIEKLMTFEDRPHVCVSTSVTDETEKEVKAFVNEWKKKVDRVQVGRTDFSWIENNNEFLCRQTFLSRKKPCRDVRLRLSIDFDGYVTPCCTDFDNFLIIGDACEKPIKKIWNSRKLKNIRKHIENRNFKFNKLCARCYQQW